MNYKNTILIAVTALSIGGCTEQGREAFHSADQSTSQAAQKMGDAIKTDAQATGKVLKKDSAVASKKMDAELQVGKKEAAQSEETMKVKTAFSSAAGLDTSKLAVETQGKKIYLKGSVPSAAQKKQADQIAKGIAGGNYTVADELGIAPH